MYKALAARDASFEGTFVAGITTTGIVCRPGCPARTPKLENVEFFASTREALLAGYRPCKRCRPLEVAGTTPKWLRALLADVERDPDRRWRDQDLRERELDPARVRRWFKSQHGMTFHGYQRARRLGRALGRMQQGRASTDAAFESGYESLSGFREAFQKLFGATPKGARLTTRVLVDRIATPLGPMLAAATDDGLCLLEFVDRRMLETQIERLRRHLGAHFVPGPHAITRDTASQLREYFAGRRKSFDLPLVVPGTDFQCEVWRELGTIPFGVTRSYGEQARRIGRPDAVRAVGKANGDNRIAIIVPCHRVLAADGKLTGYGGQLWRKRALLELEGVRLTEPACAP